MLMCEPKGQGVPDKDPVAQLEFMYFSGLSGLGHWHSDIINFSTKSLRFLCCCDMEVEI